MASLPNYLLTHRKRLDLSQEEMAFLLGVRGMSRGSKVSRDESGTREPSLEDVLAYELIYDKPARELFAGIYEEVAANLAKRAKLLSFRKFEDESQKHRETIANLLERFATQATSNAEEQ